MAMMSQGSISEDKAYGHSARAQKWLDQLCQVESRMLSNWEEFSVHRSDVQHSLRELTEAVRRKQEPHLEGEVEKCHRRLQELSQSNEEVMCRLGDLKATVENGQQSLEGLRSRVSVKLQEIAASFEEQKKELSSVSQELLAESATAKRQSKAVAEELLRKMAELNQKLGENMASVEEESVSRFEGLREEVQGLANRQAKKFEAQLEEKWRTLRTEMRSQLDEVAETTRAELARVKGLQDCTHEKVRFEAVAGRESAQRIEAQLQELRAERLEMEAQGMQNAEWLKQEIAKVKKDLEEKMARKDGEKLESELKKLIEQVQEDSLNFQFQSLQRKRDRAKELIKQKKYEEAEHLQKEVWQLNLKFKEDDWLRIEAEHQYASTLMLQRKFTEALHHQQKVVEAAEDKFKDDPLTLEAMYNLACTLWHLNKFDKKAKEYFEKVVQKCKHAKQDDLAQQCQKHLEAIRDGQSAEGSGAEVAPRGSQKRHVMLSGRFNDDKTKAYMKKIKVALEQLNIDVFMVEKGIGEEYAAPTMLGMYNAKAMVIFGTAEYGAKTGVQYETYFELQYAYQEKIFLIPLRLCKEWPPKPTDADGGHLGAAQNSFVLRPSIIRAEDIKMENPREMAKKIAEAVRQHDASQEEEEAKGRSKQQEVQSEAAQSSEELVRVWDAIDALQAADQERNCQLEQLTHTCHELAEARQGVLADVDGCQSNTRQLEADLRSLGARVEAVASSAAHCSKDVADVKARARDVEKSQLHCHELLQQRTSELQELLERRTYESSGKLEATCQALRLADAERQRQLEQLSRSCDSLAEARKGIVAEVDSCHSIDRQLEEAVRRLDGRVERASSLALQCSEGVADAKGFARELSEKVLAQCGELLENRSLEMKELLEQQAAEAISKMEVLKVSNNECHQQLDFLSRALAELSEARRGMFAEVESCQSSDRKLEESLRRMENRVERLSSVTTQCSEGLNEQKTLAQQNTEKAQLQCTELLELRIRELKEQLKHREELSSNTAKEVKAQGDALAQLARKQELTVESLQAGHGDLRRSVEAQFRRQEQLERQGSESSAALQALQVLVVERGQQLERVSKVCSELSEARKGMVTEVENCRLIQRQLEDALHRVDARLESVSSVAAQCSGGVVDVKAFAQAAADKARNEAFAQGRELLELRSGELKEQMDRKMGEMVPKVEALKLSSNEHHQQLEQLLEQRKGLLSDVEQLRASGRQLEDTLRGQGVQLTQALQGVVEAKSMAEKGATRAREQLESRSVELKELVEQRFGEGSVKLEALRASDSEQLQQLQQLAKTCAELGESSRGSTAGIESCHRQLEEAVRRVDARFERMAVMTSQCAEGTSEMKSFVREVTEKTALQCKDLLENRHSEIKELVTQLRQETRSIEKDGRSQKDEVSELKKQKESLETTQELLKRQTLDMASDLQALKLADAEQVTQLERLSRALAELTEMKKGISADFEVCRTFDRKLEAALRSMDEKISIVDAQCREGFADLKVAQETADKAREEQLHCWHQHSEQLEQRASEIKALKTQWNDVSQQMEQLMEARRGMRTELQGCQTAERQLEGRLERLFAMATQCSEGLGEVKAFARECSERVQQQSKELAEQRLGEVKELVERRSAETAARLEALKASSLEHTQELEQWKTLSEKVSDVRRGLVVELEKAQSTGRQHDESLRLCESRLEKLSSGVSEISQGVVDAKALAQKGVDRAQQSFELTQQRAVELKELLEQQGADTGPKLEALRSAQAEHSKQLEQLGRSCGDLTEARRGLLADVEKCQSASRQLEEALRHAEVKIEKISSFSNQHSEGLAEARTFARDSAEKAVLQLRQLLESQVAELKEQMQEQMERRSGDAFKALKALEVDQQQQLERLSRTSAELLEAKKGLLQDLEKCQSMERQLEESLRHVDARLERVSLVATQSSEGVAEVKTLALHSAENAVMRSRDLLEQRSAELKARSDAAHEELRSVRVFIQEEGQRHLQASHAEASACEHRVREWLVVHEKEAQDLRANLDEQMKRQETLSTALQEVSEIFQSKVSKVTTDFAEQKDNLKKYLTDALRKCEQKLQALTAQPRVMALVMDELEGVVRGVTQRELQVFQREALDSMEWKLERCVQWLHGANVKLGLNPQGTLFSTDRFREMLFEESDPVTPGSQPRGTIQSARARSGSRTRS